MFEILVTKSTTYAAKTGGGVISGITEVHLLAEGAMAVFTNENELVTAANASTIFENRPSFYIAVGANNTTNIGSKLSQPINRSNVNYTRREYAAAVKQKITVGEGADASGDLNFGTLVAGTYVRYRIFDVTNAVTPPDKIERYEYKVKTGDTESIVIAAIAALINAKSTIAVATLQGGVGTYVGMFLTAKNYYQSLEVTGDDVAIDSTIDYTTTARGSVVMDFGVGMGTQVAALEEEYSAYEGNTSKVHLASSYFSGTKMADVAGTYDMYNFTWQTIKRSSIKNVPATTQELVVAIPDGGTQQSTFGTIMLYACQQESIVFNGIES